jgi:hypothetical protein
MMVTIESAGITDVGRRRDQNEDSLFIDDGMGLWQRSTPAFQKKPANYWPASTYPTVSSIKPL